MHLLLDAYNPTNENGIRKKIKFIILEVKFDEIKNKIKLIAKKNSPIVSALRKNPSKLHFHPSNLLKKCFGYQSQALFGQNNNNS